MATPRTITIGKGTEGERTITSTGERDPRGFETFRGPGGERLTQQGDQFIVGRAAQTSVTTQNNDPVANIFSDPASTPKQKFAANLFTLLTRKREQQAEFRTNLREKEKGLRDKALDISSEPTPEDLRRFDPAVAETRRAGLQQGVQVESDAVQRQTANTEELFKAGTQALEQARLLGEDMFPKQVDPATIQNFASLVQSGQLSINQIPQEFMASVIAQVDPSQIELPLGEQLELQKTRAQILLLQAQTSKARRVTGAGGGVGNVVPGKAETLSANSQAILTNPGLFDKFTPTERAKVVQELVTFGVPDEVLDSLTVKFSDKTRKELTDLGNLNTKIDQAIAGIEGGAFKTGPFESRKNSLLALTPFGSPPGFDQFAALTNITSAQKMKELSGVQFSEKEFARLKAFLPNVNDQETKVLNKLNLFKEETERLMQTRVENQFKTVLDFQGGFSGGAVDDIDAFLDSF